MRCVVYYYCVCCTSCISYSPSFTCGVCTFFFWKKDTNTHTRGRSRPKGRLRSKRSSEKPSSFRQFHSFSSFPHLIVFSFSHVMHELLSFLFFFFPSREKERERERTRKVYSACCLHLHRNILSIPYPAWGCSPLSLSGSGSVPISAALVKTGIERCYI